MDRQKLLMIFGGAAACAALLTWFLWAQTAAPKTEALTSVAAAARDLPAGTRLKASDVKLVKMSAKDAPLSAQKETKALVDRVLIFPVGASELITAAKLASLGGAEGVSAIIEPGKRAVSVAITDSAGAAGLIQPRAHVDVLFTRTGNMTEAITTTILQDVTVLSVGRVTEVTPADAKAPPRPQNYAVTLLVTPDEAGKLELAKNQGRISLALRNPVDASRIEDLQPVTGDVLDPYLGRPRRQQRPGAGSAIGSKSAWNRLTGEDEEEKKKPAAPPPPPPPPPKIVVDVYRGEKHVQEVFQK
jgi:pilus assembly protein CpaB